MFSNSTLFKRRVRVYALSVEIHCLRELALPHGITLRHQTCVKTLHGLADELAVTSIFLRYANVAGSLFYAALAAQAETGRGSWRKSPSGLVNPCLVLGVPRGLPSKTPKDALVSSLSIVVVSEKPELR